MKTRRERRIVIEHAFRKLHEAGFKLRRLKNFRAKHVRHILQVWRDSGLQASTYSTYASHLRTLCSWLQKLQLAQVIDAFIAEQPHLVRRRTVTDKDRSEKGASVSVIEVLERALALDARFAAQLAIARVFGLRALESWLFRPHLALRDDGTLQLLWGTKGGRDRFPPLVLSEDHHAVLEWAKTFARTRSESMIPRGWTVQRWRRRYYYLCQRIGLTRKSGITPHAFRHGMLLNLFEWVTGVAAAARGGTLAQTDPPADRAAREIISAVAGHAEVHISSAYLGGRRPRPESPRDEHENTSQLETKEGPRSSGSADDQGEGDS